MYRNSILLIVMLGTLYSQSIMNSLGLGLPNSNFGAASVGNGSNYITPSFSEGVSLGNPATWRNLDFTYIHTGYDGQQVTFENGGINEFSGLNRAQFIVPIKSKHAFGLSLIPYIFRTAELITQSDTTEGQITNKTEGGINALTPSIGIKLSEYESIGISYSFLFGSSRLIKSMVLESVTYAQTNRLDHSGSSIDLYVQSDRFHKDALGVSLYGHIGMTVKPISVTQYRYYLYEDNDGSGNHNTSNIASYADFPYAGNVPPPDTLKIGETYSPFTLNLGFNYAAKSDFNIVGEFGFVNNNYSDDYKNYSPLQDAISSIWHLQIGVNRFSRPIIRRWNDRFSYRSGLFSNRYILDSSKNTIMENGFALGFGFIFGATKNQIDFSYQIGYRSGLPELDMETFSKFSVGLSLGDLWFVKRREL